MKVIVFGASGMVGQGTLRECLLAEDVNQVLCIGRSPSGQNHAKLQEIKRTDLTDYADVQDSLRGFDACFFCLGVSSAGLSEQAYRKITYDIAVAAGAALCQVNPAMTFVFVSGASSDSTGKSRAMWARVKGETENALLAMNFKAVYVFRPGYIQPLHGINSRTASYRVLYRVIGPAYPLLKKMFPGSVTNTENIGRAMLRVARLGAPKKVLESGDIEALAAEA